MSEAIDRLHADAVCSLGLYLHGSEKTDRAAALKAHEAAVDALAAGAAEMTRERDATIAKLEAARIDVRAAAWRVLRYSRSHGEDCPHYNCDNGGVCDDGAMSAYAGCESPGRRCDCDVADCAALAALLSAEVVR